MNYGRGVGYDIIEHVPPKKLGIFLPLRLEKNCLINSLKLAIWNPYKGPIAQLVRATDS